ncbi:MAG: M23 family metallopeptidase [Sandaracinaceae bacterium]|nr:M23 family metallopeptidase [Sandaracinaceae bacterium]
MTKKVDISGFAWKGPMSPGPVDDTGTAADGAQDAGHGGASGPNYAKPGKSPPPTLSLDKAGVRDDWLNADAIAEWKQLSRANYGARSTGRAWVSTPLLLRAADADRRSPFAPLYVSWALDNCLADNLFEEGLDVARKFERYWEKYEFQRRPLIESVLERSAYCYRALGRASDADREFEKLIRVQRSVACNEAWPWYYRGLLAEEFGDNRRAVNCFREASSRRDGPGQDEGLDPERARRALRRIRSRKEWLRCEPEQLAKELLRALTSKNEDAVASLASETHFTLGVSRGERGFADRKTVLSALLRDLRKSRPRGNAYALAGSGAKRYLICDGWAGEVFVGQVIFAFNRVPGGWEWNGVAVTSPGPKTADIMRQVFGDHEPKENQPLAVPIKAPWPSEYSMQAGGVWGTWTALLSAEASLLATAVAAASVACLGPWWLICAPATAAAAVAAIEASFFLERQRISAARTCGFGPGGFYYNNGPTHVSSGGREAQFAIDFARYRRGAGTHTGDNITRDVPVLACSDGLVTALRGTWGDGDDRAENFIDLALVPTFLERLNFQFRYTASHLHLRGPNLLPVSLGSWVDQGFVLGFIDDTGMSLWDHLHFEIHDRTLASSTDRRGRTTRPTPMDVSHEGVPQTLNDGDGGRCIDSTNRVTNPRAYLLWLRNQWAPEPGGLIGVVAEPVRTILEILDREIASLPPDPYAGPDPSGLLTLPEPAGLPQVEPIVPPDEPNPTPPPRSRRRRRGPRAPGRS